MIMTLRIYFFCFLLVLSCSDDDSRNSDVTLSDNIEVYQPDLMDENLALVVENGSNKSYIINKEGERLQEWNFDTLLGNDLEILPDGRLIGMFKSAEADIHFGGFGGVIKILNNDSSLDWQYSYTSENFIAHHDVELLPSGNVLFLAWERVTHETAQNNGVVSPGDIFQETLIEIDPSTNQIVWKWNSLDHIVQNANPLAPNYGVVSNNPQLININYNSSVDGGNIMHANGLDYDEEKDIIYVTVNFYSEIWVLDHSTTTQEASSHTGGNYNKGGDLIYRFGNPETYENVGERKFYNVHFPNLIENDVPGKGNMLVYVNRYNNTEQSIVYELDIPENFDLQAGINNEPAIIWEFTDPTMYSRIISGAVRLPNGNTLICEGDYGLWEITQLGEVVWKYNSQNTNVWRSYTYESLP